MTPNPARALALVMKNAVMAALCLVFTAACGAYTFSGGQSSPTPDSGTVSGSVLAVPCAPVEKVDSPCTGRPVAGVELDYLVGTKIEGRTVTDASGKYSIRLEPGSYTVMFKNVMRVVSGPTKVSIAAGSNVVANYLLDSGIRVPVPN